MSETPWTPGPWACEYDVLEGDWGYRVYEVGGDCSIDHPADARLIAAAPEMAELLACLAYPPMVEYPDGRICPFIPEDVQDDAAALLARIRG